jgi:hypothetical protein
LAPSRQGFDPRLAPSREGFDDRVDRDGSLGTADDLLESDRTDEMDVRIDNARRTRAVIENQRRAAIQRRNTTRDIEQDDARSETRRNRADTSRGRLDRSDSDLDDRRNDRFDGRFDDRFDNEFIDDSDNGFNTRSRRSFDDRSAGFGDDDVPMDLSDDDFRRDGRSLPFSNQQRDRSRSQDTVRRRPVESEFMLDDRLDRGDRTPNNERLPDSSGVARTRAAQDLDRVRRQSDSILRRTEHPTGVTRGVDIAPPTGGNDNALDSSRMSDRSDPTRYDRDPRSGLPTGPRRSGFRGLDRADDQVDLNRRR